LDVSLKDKLLQIADDEGFQMMFEAASFDGFLIKAKQETLNFLLSL